MCIVIYIFAHFDRETWDELKWDFYGNKKSFQQRFSISNVDRHQRSHLSFLKGPGLCMGLFLVPDYPILAATERTVLPKCRSICRSLLLLCCFLSQAPANSSVQCLSLDNRLYIHSVLFYCCILPWLPST